MGTNVGPYWKKTFWYNEIVATNPHARKSEIDRLQKQIDELCWFLGNEPSNEAWSVQSSRMSILNEEEFH